MRVERIIGQTGGSRALRRLDEAFELVGSNRRPYSEQTRAATVIVVSSLSDPDQGVAELHSKYLGFESELVA